MQWIRQNNKCVLIFLLGRSRSQTTRPEWQLVNLVDLECNYKSKIIICYCSIVQFCYPFFSCLTSVVETSVGQWHLLYTSWWIELSSRTIIYLKFIWRVELFICWFIQALQTTKAFSNCFYFCASNLLSFCMITTLQEVRDHP